MVGDFVGLRVGESNGSRDGESVGERLGGRLGDALGDCVATGRHIYARNVVRHSIAVVCAGPEVRVAWVCVGTKLSAQTYSFVQERIQPHERLSGIYCHSFDASRLRSHRNRSHNVQNARGDS